MLVFIKLTKAEKNEPIWINANEINAITTNLVGTRNGGEVHYTYLELTGTGVIVKETPEKILDKIRTEQERLAKRGVQ